VVAAFDKSPLRLVAAALFALLAGSSFALDPFGALLEPDFAVDVFERMVR
jgi:hypothetical protein